MEIAEHEHGGCSIIAVAGRLDASTASELEHRCVGTIEAGSNKLVLDLSRLEYISSAGLRAILATAKRLKAQGGGFALCGLSGVVEKVFAISGFGSFLPVTDNVNTALEVL